MMSIWLKKHKKHRLYLGKYLTRKWNHNKTGNDRLRKFTIYYMRENTPPPGQKFAPVEKIRIWNRYCFKRDVPNT